MIRDREIKIRVTQDELDYISNVCNTHGMSKSECIRQAVRRGFNQNEKDIAQKICAMQSIINRMNGIGVTEEDINSLTKEMNELWQFLN